MIWLLLILLLIFYKLQLLLVVVFVLLPKQGGWYSQILVIKYSFFYLSFTFYYDHNHSSYSTVYLINYNLISILINSFFLKFNSMSHYQPPLSFLMVSPLLILFINKYFIDFIYFPLYLFIYNLGFYFPDGLLSPFNNSSSHYIFLLSITLLYTIHI